MIRLKWFNLGVYMFTTVDEGHTTTFERRSALNPLIITGKVEKIVFTKFHSITQCLRINNLDSGEVWGCLLFTKTVMGKQFLIFQTQYRS